MNSSSNKTLSTQNQKQIHKKIYKLFKILFDKKYFRTKHVSLLCFIQLLVKTKGQHRCHLRFLIDFSMSHLVAALRHYPK